MLSTGVTSNRITIFSTLRLFTLPSRIIMYTQTLDLPISEAYSFGVYHFVVSDVCIDYVGRYLLE